MTMRKHRRQQIWDILREQKTVFVSANVLAGKTGMNPKNVATLMLGLEKAGYVEVLKQRDVFTGKLVKTWRLLKDCGVDAPRIDRHGQPLPETLSSVAWRTIKILKSFGLDELQVHIGMSHTIARSTLRHYTALLAKAGYLKNTGTANRPHYVLVKNTGGRAPQVWHITEVYDPNTQETVYRQEQSNDE